MNSSNWMVLLVGLFGAGGFSALGGYLLAGRNERKRDDREERRNQKARQGTQIDEARAFQRDTLLELHDTLHKLNRVAGRLTYTDEMRYRETGRYGRDPVKELSDEFSELLGAVNRLRVRLFDLDLRNAIELYSRSLIMVSITPVPRQDGDDAQERERVKQVWEKAAHQFMDLESRLGSILRAQFPGSELGLLS